ncbi:MAG: DUF294 nucleotidyltransferase-like domain-containing protein [Flavobacteriales bacterium]|nr:DUF294 nucleotidyltransferase-like domain-containing protein [Flavobacteriales bacterium]
MQLSNSNKFLSFTGSIGDLAHADILSVESSCTVEKASELLVRPDIEYLVVMEKGVPAGMVSKDDVITHGMLKRDSLDAPISDIMNSQIVSVEKSAQVFESLMFMVRHDLKYLLVTEGNKPLGVVTQDDWLVDQINYPTMLLRKIQDAQTMEKLVVLQEEAKETVWKNFIDQGNARSLTNIVTMVNDTTTKRIIQMALDEMRKNGKGIPPVPFAWIGMGSEGRKAQTLSTDQDNGIIYQDDEELDASETKKWFLEFAKLITAKLDQCGFPFCEGNIMATNPELCNPITEWKKMFTRIMTKADAKELLEASIYFDFRCIYGKKELVDALWEHLFAARETHTLFMRHLAENMLEASRPPIKNLKWLLPEFLNLTPAPFNLKREASAPLDAAIRLLALNDNISETHTLERLQKVMEKGNMPKSLADEVHHAFDFILRLRFRLEFKAKNRTNATDTKHMVDVSELLPLQVKNLKSALRTIYQLQDYAFKQVTQTSVPWSMR